MSEGGAPVLITIDPGTGTGTITLNRPPLNILDIATLRALGDAIDEVVERAGCAIVILRAAGGKAFCAGAEVGDHVPEKAPEMLDAFHRVARRLSGMDAVSVAAVQGAALGAGFELAMCCDLIVASDSANFGLPEINLGCFPPIAAAALPGRIGRHRAAEVVLTGRRFSAAEAVTMGLVTRQVDAEFFDAEVAALLGELQTKSRSALKVAVSVLRRAVSQPFDAALSMAEKAYVEELLPLEDAREGILAFIEKRKPRWEHR
jgi:cyclohexa-1,5-dienecarbonyl-CoA hydratase